MSIQAMAELAGNTQELSVSELSGAIKRAMETTFDFVRVRGEVSGFKGPVASGHVYFGLKDQNARIDAVIWKGVYSRLKFRPEDGIEVIATGRVSTFPGSSRYQIIIDTLEPAGTGALLMQIEERRKRLAAEGLFDAARKQILPYLPTVIGVVTSPTGAVIRDIIHRVAERFPRQVIVWPVRVQGEASAGEVAGAIRGFNALPENGPIRRPDVIIVARGGGSLEDLWSFNEEIVVRAAAESMIPLISAVGHETDTTLIDFAADRRAPTPTGAAEMVVPVRSELRANTAALGLRLPASLGRLVELRRRALRSASRALPGLDVLLSVPRQRVELAASRLGPAMRLCLEHRRSRAATLGNRLARQSPQARLARMGERVQRLGAQLQTVHTARLRRESQNIARCRDRIDAFGQRLLRALVHNSERQKQRLGTLSSLLDTLGYRQVLNRGFALVRNAAGAPVRAAAHLENGSSLEIEFADGRISAIARDGGKPAPRGARPSGQGTLF